MLQKSTIFLFSQVGISISLVLTQSHKDRGSEYYQDYVVGNDDGFETLKGKLKIQNKLYLKDVVEDDSNQIIPKLKYRYSHEEDEAGVEMKPKLSFKHTRSKKEVRGFDLTNQEKEKFKIWNDGVIPYYIDIVSFGDKVLRDKIRKHLQMVNSATGISFVELEKPPDDEKERWVFFLNRRGLLGCGDHNVMNFTLQGVQRVVLGYDCMSTRGELAEAVMSILGIPAEHNAPDRDQHIKVRMDNIMPDKKYLFEKLGDKDWLFHDLHYDFSSVTHYDLHKYSINGRATIVPTMHHYEEFKPGTSYSPSDLRKIKMLYSYIVKKKQMETSVCEKLFEIGKIDRRDKERIKSRHKPSRYRGIAKGNSLSSSSSSSDISEEKEKKKHQKLEGEEKHSQEYERLNDVSDEFQSQEKRSGKSDKLFYHHGQKAPSLASTWLQASNYDTSMEKKMQQKYKNRLQERKKTKLVSKDKKTPLPLQKSDYDTTKEEKVQEKHKKEGQIVLLNAPARYNGKWKKKKTTISSWILLSDYDSTEDIKRVPLKGQIQDPLTILSDYQTDEGK